jgi:hypothetical protein
MLLKEYLDELNKLVKKDKTLLDCRVIYAKDDEGNGYQVVSNTAEVFFVDRDDSEYYIEQIYDEVDVSEYEIDAEKVVIIN